MPNKKLSAEEKNLFPILVVSRRTSIRLSIERYLSSCGYLVETSEEGEEAIEIDRDFLSQLLIIDTPPADMSLEQLLRGLLKSRNLMKDVMQVTNVPVLLLSAPNDLDMDERKFKIYGILERLDKPVNLQKLGKAVHDVLTGKLRLEENATTTVAILDPEKRAIEYFSKLLASDDVDVLGGSNESDILRIENAGVLVVEVMGLQTDDPASFIREYKHLHPLTEIIVTTAFHDEEMEDDMLDAGARSVVNKPINPIAFRQVVRKAVMHYRAARERRGRSD